MQFRQYRYKTGTGCVGINKMLVPIEGFSLPLLYKEIPFTLLFTLELKRSLTDDYIKQNF